MNLLKPACSLVAAVVLAHTSAVAVAQEQTQTEAPAVRLYDPAQLPLDRYTIVKRLWTGTWWGSFMVPTYPDAPSAIEALVSKAADLGADGVINVSCLSDSAWEDRYYCYGLAIKLKPSPTFVAPPPADG